MSNNATRRPDDLTMRAWIRDTAMRMFADRGYAGTSMRAVAAAVGVSIGLVQHHFGTKEGLRDACDDVAIGRMLDEARDATERTAPFAMPEHARIDPVMLAYLGRALIDGSPTAAKLFDAGSEMAESWLRAGWPERFDSDAEGQPRVRAAAAVMGTMHLGPIALHAHLSRRLGTAVLDEADIIPTAIADVYEAMARELAPLTPDEGETDE